MLFHKGWVGVRYRGEKNNTETLWGRERITARVRIYSGISIFIFLNMHAVVISMVFAFTWRAFSVVYAGTESKH